MSVTSHFFNHEGQLSVGAPCPWRHVFLIMEVSWGPVSVTSRFLIMEVGWGPMSVTSRFLIIEVKKQTWNHETPTKNHKKPTQPTSMIKKRYITDTGPNRPPWLKNVTSLTRGPNWPPWLKTWRHWHGAPTDLGTQWQRHAMQWSNLTDKNHHDFNFLAFVVFQDVHKSYSKCKNSIQFCRRDHLDYRSD